jgi:hypothetical protein
MERIVASGRGVSASLVDAARQYFALVEVKQESKKKPAAKKAKPVAFPDALTVALEEAAAGAVEPAVVTVVSDVVVPVAVSEKPKKLAACPVCGGSTKAWGSMRRCDKCSRNW